MIAIRPVVLLVIIAEKMNVFPAKLSNFLFLDFLEISLQLIRSAVNIINENFFIVLFFTISGKWMSEGIIKALCDKVVSR